jgi:predicted heme/steroid binding protein
MTEGLLRLTKAELAQHDGSDASLPLYIAVRGRIYDVSAGRSFYGPGGGDGLRVE